MITFFNRKELLVTFSMERQAEIREILASKNVEYFVNVVNRKSPSGGSRRNTATFGENADLQYEYKIYVKKFDYDQAAYLIR